MSKYTSVFDIVGPAMIGPSSSHTAGAAKIGLMARNIFNDQPEHIEVIFYGSFAKTYKGHGTDLAIIGGLLGYSAHDQRIVNSATDAEYLGINIELITSNEEADHPNTVKIIMRNNNRSFEVVGISPGGGRAEIIEINGFQVKAAADSNFSLIFHFDKYGVIAAVANLLASRGINIGHMEVARKSKGAEALMVIQTDQQVGGEITGEIESLDHITDVVVFNK
ncbi:MAG: L-serine ammonia-lyase, iron-sulfur-dependent, subunit beta [Firmicutes bacterium]|nr:L-serine ammonia-lyase, iron-sulfur-dependent, subunit beta [Bacillota bacterium]